MIGVSATTGILRLVYDEHWASDVIAGWLVGTAAGYVLPSVLHYGFGSGRPPGEIVSGSLHALPTLLSYPAGAGAGLVGVF
jgi:membrane-associated phospholipid phosphatase